MAFKATEESLTPENNLRFTFVDSTPNKNPTVRHLSSPHERVTHAIIKWKCPLHEEYKENSMTGKCFQFSSQKQPQTFLGISTQTNKAKETRIYHADCVCLCAMFACLSVGHR